MPLIRTLGRSLGALFYRDKALRHTQSLFIGFGGLFHSASLSSCGMYFVNCWQSGLASIKPSGSAYEKSHVADIVSGIFDESGLERSDFPDFSMTSFSFGWIVAVLPSCACVRFDEDYWRYDLPFFTASHSAFSAFKIGA
jgi:hypothetical protein